MKQTIAPGSVMHPAFREPMLRDSKRRFEEKTRTAFLR